MVGMVGKWRRERWRRVNVRMGRRDQFKNKLFLTAEFLKCFIMLHAIVHIVKWQLNSPYILPITNTAQLPSIDIYGNICGRGLVPEALLLSLQGLFVRWWGFGGNDIIHPRPVFVQPKKNILCRPSTVFYRKVSVVQKPVLIWCNDEVFPN